MPLIDAFVRKSYDEQGVASVWLFPLGLVFLISAAALALVAIEAFALSLIIPGAATDDPSVRIVPGQVVSQSA
jgi:hypothetical protein